MKMKLTACLAVTGLFLSCLHPAAAADLTAGMKKSALELKSAGPVAFGPGGILFVADPLGAAVHAIATGDTVKAGKTGAIAWRLSTGRSPLPWVPRPTRSGFRTWRSTRPRGPPTFRSPAAAVLPLPGLLLPSAVESSKPLISQT